MQMLSMILRRMLPKMITIIKPINNYHDHKFIFLCNHLFFKSINLTLYNKHIFYFKFNLLLFIIFIIMIYIFLM
jgi:hypothetical protein